MQLKLLSIFFIFSSICTFAFANNGFKGSFEPIPKKIQQDMVGYTWHKGCPMGLNKLSYLTISYLGFDDKTHQGHLIVLTELAGQTLQIFHKLYQQHFPIAKMQLPSTYKAKDDWPSTEDNNTSAFFCRADDQSLGHFSPHSYGIAIDINPVYNPSIVKKTKKHGDVQPSKGRPYLDRSLKQRGMITTSIAELFARHGWRWGIYFDDGKDYMHFGKAMDRHYKSPILIYSPTVK